MQMAATPARPTGSFVNLLRVGHSGVRLSAASGCPGRDFTQTMNRYLQARR